MLLQYLYLYVARYLQQKRRVFAPAIPIAKVATGIPAGICTIDNKLSWPLSVLDLTGTPNTGKVVLPQPFQVNVQHRQLLLL